MLAWAVRGEVSVKLFSSYDTGYRNSPVTITLRVSVRLPFAEKWS